MKTPALLLGVLLAGSATLLAAPPKGSMLISAENMGSSDHYPLVPGGWVNALALIGNFRVAANEIVFDQTNKVLKCKGVTSISPGYVTSAAKDVTLPVDVDNVYFLNPTGIVVNPKPESSATEAPFVGPLFTRAHPILPQAAPAVQPFSNGLPALDLKLSPPTK